MQVSFFRQFPVELNISGRTRALKLVAGFSGSVDQESGMAVSLVDVDRWSQEVIEMLASEQFSDWNQAIQKAHVELSKRGPLTRVELEDPMDLSRVELC